MKNKKNKVDEEELSSHSESEVEEKKKVTKKRSKQAESDSESEETGKKKSKGSASKRSAKRQKVESDQESESSSEKKKSKGKDKKKKVVSSEESEVEEKKQKSKKSSKSKSKDSDDSSEEKQGKKKDKVEAKKEKKSEEEKEKKSKESKTGQKAFKPPARKVPAEKDTKDKGKGKGKEKEESKGKKSKKERDPLEPKKPLSAYMLFSQEKREEVKKENPEAKNTDIISLLADAWKSLSSEAKKPFEKKAVKAKEDYEAAKKKFLEAGGQLSSRSSKKDGKKEKAVKKKVTKEKPASKKRKRSSKSESESEEGEDEMSSEGSASEQESEGEVEESSGGEEESEEAKRLRETLTDKKSQGVLCLSTVNKEDKELVVRAIENFKKFRLEQECVDSNSILIVGSNVRTIKVLTALACGAWVVTPAWIFNCIEQGKWTDDAATLASFESSDWPTRQQRMEKGPLLKDKGVHIHGDLAPSTEFVQKLVKLAGGKIALTFRSSDISIIGLRSRLLEIPEEDGLPPRVKETWLYDSLAANELKSSNSSVYTVMEPTEEEEEERQRLSQEMTEAD